MTTDRGPAQDGARSRVEVVALQLRARPGAVEANRERLAAAVRGLDGEPDLIVAPELCVTGYDLDRLGGHGHRLAETLQGPTVALAAELAAERRATVVVGLLETDDGRLYDSAVVVGPGGVPASYRKSHLYPPETAVFAAGDRLLTTPSTAGHLGLMICFEHAFPEIATTLALDGAQVLVIPSAVPVGYEHLLALRTRARAQDNQVFAVAANLTGDGFCGGSMIADPRGEVLAAARAEEAAIRATIDLEAIQRERRLEPALRLRRAELYRAGPPARTGLSLE
jgi:predicted amidohydrolase